MQGCDVMRAAIFDMDGVLIDSEPLWRIGERQTFSAVGLELSEAECERTMGLRSDEVIRYWYEQAPWQGPTPDEVDDRLTARMQELIGERGEPMSGAGHAIAIARKAGLRLGLATSSRPEIIAAVLARLRLDGVFAVTRSAVDEPRGKPDPAVFLSTARELGVEPAECVVIEDSKAGVAAARAAGMRVIAVPPPHLYDDPGYDEADAKLGSLAEITEEILLG